MPKLKHVIDLMIYLSVALGPILLLQLYGFVPNWLFYSVFVGWIAYLLVAVAIWRHVSFAYPATFLLSIMTLAVSLPQPEHYSFAAEGLLGGELTFVVGSLLQLALLILIPVYLVKMRRLKQVH